MKNKIQISGIFCLLLLAFLGVHGKAYSFSVSTTADVSAIGTDGSLTGQVFPPANGPVTTSASVGTSVTLGNAMKAIVDKLGNASEDNFCTTLDMAVQGLDPAGSASLAWNKDSYKMNAGLDADASVSEDQKAQYESLKDAYADFNDALALSVDASTTTSLREGAALRSAYLELMAQYRTGTVNEEQAGALKSFINRAKSCVSSDGDAALTASLSGAINTDATATVETPVVVTRADIDADTNKDIASASVSSKTAFAEYAKSVLANNDSVVSVTGDTSHVEVVATSKGKLFAFIPVNMNVKTTVMGDGKVTVKYPWYKFLVRIPNKVTSQVVMDKLPSDVTSATTLSAHAQAASVDAVSQLFTTATVSDDEINTDTTTDTTTDTSTDATTTE